MKATHSKKQKTGVMAGYTGFSAGRINQRYVYIPIDKMCDPVSSSVCFSSSLLSLYTHLRALCQARKRASTQARKRASALSLSPARARARASACFLLFSYKYLLYARTRAQEKKVTVCTKSRVYNRMLIHTGQPGASCASMRHIYKAYTYI